MTTFLDTLEASAKKATKGPWRSQVDDSHDGPPECDDHQVAALYPADNTWWAIASTSNSWHSKERTQDNERANADFIAAANPDNILALVRVARAAIEFAAVAEKQLYPTPDKPNTAWSKMRAVQAALDALPK